MQRRNYDKQRQKIFSVRKLLWLPNWNFKNHLKKPYWTNIKIINGCMYNCDNLQVVWVLKKKMLDTKYILQPSNDANKLVYIFIFLIFFLQKGSMSEDIRDWINSLKNRASALPTQLITALHCWSDIWIKSKRLKLGSLPGLLTRTKRGENIFGGGATSLRVATSCNSQSS